MKTFTYVQTKTSVPTAAATSIALAFDSAVTLNSVILVAVQYNYTTATNVSSVTDTLGNTYTRINGTTNATDSSLELWYAYKVKQGATTVTVNFTNSVTHGLLLDEVYGLMYEHDPYDVSIAATNTGTVHSTGNGARCDKILELWVVAGGNKYDGTEITYSGTYTNTTRNGNATTGLEVSIGHRNITSTSSINGSITTATSISANVIAAGFKIDWQTYIRLQEATFSDSSSGTSKNISLSNNCHDRSLLVLTAMDNYSAGNQISGITDTAGNTWQRATSISNSSSLNNEIWYAYNCKGGVKPTLTITYSNSVTVAMVLREYKNVKFMANPLDKTGAAIDSTSLYLSSATGIRTSAVQLIVGSAGWNHASITASLTGTVSTSLTQVADGTSNNRACMWERDIPNAASQSAQIAQSGGSTTMAVCCATFHLAAFETTTAEDGFTYALGDGLGALITGYDSTAFEIYSFTTSAGAPDPNSTQSAKYYGFWFFDYPDLPLNAVITGIKFHYNVGDAYDDSQSDGWYLYTDNTNLIGSTLSYADHGDLTQNSHSLGVQPATLGWREVDLSSSEFSNRNYPLAIMLEHKTSNLTGAYTTCNSQETSSPAFLEFFYRINTLAQQGVG